MSRRVASKAPHGSGFYALILMVAVSGGMFFGFVSLGDVSRASMWWRIGFAVPALLFFAGAAQAAERIWWPEQAVARSGGLGGRLRRRLFKVRMGALGVSVVGYLALSASWVDRSEAVESFCANARVVLLALLFVYYCLVDLSGERAMTPATWWYPRKRRRKTVREAEPLS